MRGFSGGRFFSSTSVKFTCNNNHQVEDFGCFFFFVFFSKLISMKGREVPALHLIFVT